MTTGALCCWCIEVIWQCEVITACLIGGLVACYCVESLPEVLCVFFGVSEVTCVHIPQFKLEVKVLHPMQS